MDASCYKIIYRTVLIKSNQNSGTQKAQQVFVVNKWTKSQENKFTKEKKKEID